MSEPKRVVIGFTPFHALFAERLIPVIGGDVYCLFTKGWPAVVGYRKLGFFGRGGILHGLGYLASFLYFSIILRFWLWRGVAVEVYLPHPKNIFSNFLFFSKKVSKVHVYEDGLLNYYDAPVERAKVKGGLRMIAWLCGVPFQGFSGHLAGYDTGRVSNLYVSRASRVVAKTKVDRVVQVVPESLPVSPIAGRVLFLDQDVSSLISQEQRVEVVGEMFRLYPFDKYTYYYKGHHDFNGNGLAMHRLEKSLEGLPAEAVVGELQPQLVVSFFSSALLNIATLHPNINCVSLAAEYVHVSRDGVPCSLAMIFKEAGVFCFPKQSDLRSV